ncbi:hypothetical protein Poli38472_014215 [Pythium oligandrum]|uniref:Uncharacterized protein n=1 Tax=Pythium oligandrum TaxID=41045 RepID=A0A8K1CJJ9_PYTOL|nr:hypothetical protein Poli38472_014215 [Pythium oligandrum]|eukprot:TMW64098.1 hypothetical protein Poli38472_014215 [Pythium oligandrum]
MRGRKTTPSSLDAAPTSSESDDEGVANASAAGEVSRKRRPYRSTYYVRKAEISSLQEQIDALTKRIEQLKDEQPVTIKDVERAREENATLHHSLAESDLVLARAHSLILGELATYPRNPLAMTIRLPADADDRQHTLDDLLVAKLDTSTQFVLERIKYLSLDQCHRQVQSFSTPEGDMMLIQSDITSFNDVESVQQVFEDVQLAYAHREFKIWEHLGVSSICDTDTDQRRPATHVRYLSSIPGGVDIEVNLAQFQRFAESSTHLNEPHGVIVVESIDEDALYPYQPEFRVRVDVSAVVLMVERPRPPTQAKSDSIDVSLIRWAFTHVHNPQFPVTPQMKQELLDLYPRWGDALRKIMVEHVEARQRQRGQKS